jgi:hypothetical protein
MVELNAHEAGNGGKKPREAYSLPSLLYSETAEREHALALQETASPGFELQTSESLDVRDAGVDCSFSRDGSVALNALPLGLRQTDCRWCFHPAAMSSCPKHGRSRISPGFRFAEPLVLEPLATTASGSPQLLGPEQRAEAWWTWNMSTGS